MTSIWLEARGAFVGSSFVAEATFVVMLLRCSGQCSDLFAASAVLWLSNLGLYGR